MRNKIVSAAEVVAIIRSGDTVATSGFVGVGTPDEVIRALEQRYLDTGEPRDLSLVFAAAPGDGAEKGLNRLAHDGLVRRLVGGHFGLVPKLARRAASPTCSGRLPGARPGSCPRSGCTPSSIRATRAASSMPGRRTISSS